jgi:hypothetical protein
MSASANQTFADVFNTLSQGVRELAGWDGSMIRKAHDFGALNGGQTNGTFRDFYLMFNQSAMKDIGVTMLYTVYDALVHDRRTPEKILQAYVAPLSEAIGAAIDQSDPAKLHLVDLLNFRDRYRTAAESGRFQGEEKTQIAQVVQKFSQKIAIKNGY